MTNEAVRHKPCIEDRERLLIEQRGAVIPLANGRGVALVDVADLPLVAGYSWCLHSQGYAVARIPGGCGRLVYMHQVITGHRYVDHENGDRLDNRRSKLRPATQGQNVANSGSRGGTSRYKGVHLERRTGRWVTQIKVDGRRRHLGTFDTEEEAARVYDAAALAAWGAFARLNCQA